MPIEINDADAELYQLALADALCWFQGFKAAAELSEKEIEVPLNLGRLRELSSRLQKSPSGPIPF